MTNDVMIESKQQLRRPNPQPTCPLAAAVLHTGFATECSICRTQPWIGLVEGIAWAKKAA